MHLSYKYRLYPNRTQTDALNVSMAIPDIKARLDIVDVARRYVDLKPRGSYEHVGLCPFHHERTPSFKVDAQRQRFKCFGCDAGGDVIDLIQAAERLDKATALARARELGNGVEPIARPASHVDAAAETKRSERAQELWRQSQSISPLNAYLMARKLQRWNHDTLRWHPACPWERGHAGCILAPVNCAETGHVVAIWRIRPEPNGKAVRWGLGPTKGNCSRLYHAYAEPIGIAEGVEDAIAVRLLTGLPCWAALSGGLMGKVRVPLHIPAVTIFADADDSGLNGARGLAGRLKAEGRKADIFTARGAKDANDRLKAGGFHGNSLEEHFEPASA